MRCAVFYNRLGQERLCVNNGDCQTCRVPEGFGFRWDVSKPGFVLKYRVPSTRETVGIIIRECLAEEAPMTIEMEE